MYYTDIHTSTDRLRIMALYNNVCKSRSIVRLLQGCTHHGAQTTHSSRERGECVTQYICDISEETYKTLDLFTPQTSDARVLLLRSSNAQYTYTDSQLTPCIYREPLHMAQQSPICIQLSSQQVRGRRLLGNSTLAASFVFPVGLQMTILSCPSQIPLLMNKTISSQSSVNHIRSFPIKSLPLDASCQTTVSSVTISPEYSTPYIPHRSALSPADLSPLFY